MPVPLFVVDAFTAEPFRGNPAAVCLLDRPPPETWMQSVAAEMHLSETAFCMPRGDGFDLRWFTPTTEVDLCGHATLATAHVLRETGRLGVGEPARFSTRSGLLVAVPTADGITLDFPATPPEPVDPPPGLAAALGLSPRDASDVLRSPFDHVVVVPDPATVTGLAPDLDALAAIETRAVVVTAAGGAAGVDFVSRCFGPRVGIPEDPVTGSSHCALGPLWAARLGRRDLVASQVSARGGILHVSVVHDRVRLTGEAVTVVRGELAADPPSGDG